jgi:dTDP-4-dehydrorhamnose 3,5-epimerase
MPSASRVLFYWRLMQCAELKLKGAFVIEVDKKEDERGFFARTWSEKEFCAQRIDFAPAQSSISYNRLKGTLRGLHYQAAPYQESKLVRCTRGVIFDVIIDLRQDSPTYHAWFGIELTAASYRALYVPKDFAHGFQTLTDDTEVLYLMSDAYHPESERGIRWNDPALAIKWPLDITAISDKDRRWPALFAKPT